MLKYFSLLLQFQEISCQNSSLPSTNADSGDSLGVTLFPPSLARAGSISLKGALQSPAILVILYDRASACHTQSKSTPKKLKAHFSSEVLKSQGHLPRTDITSPHREVQGHHGAGSICTHRHQTLLPAPWKNSCTSGIWAALCLWDERSKVQRLMSSYCSPHLPVGSPSRNGARHSSG